MKINIRNKYNKFDKIMINEFADKIINEFIQSGKEEIVVVNIGTDKCIGDSVAPMVGTFLKNNKSDLQVYGTLIKPMHALNLKKRINIINDEHPNAFIVAVDACLGDKESIGQVILKDIPIYPGKGVGKELPSVGDMSIKLIVDSADSSMIFTSRSIRLSFIYKAAETIAKILMCVDDKIHDLNVENREVAIGF